MGKNMLQIVVLPLTDGQFGVAYQSAECRHIIQKFISRSMAESFAWKMQYDRAMMSQLEVRHGR